MMAVAGLAGLALSFGPALPGYAWLHTHVPLFAGLRAAARWGLLPLIAVAVLAAYTVANIERRWGRATYWPAVALLLLAIPIDRGAARPDGRLRASRRFRPSTTTSATRGGQSSWSSRCTVAPRSARTRSTWSASTRHFRPLVNGYSGFESAGFRDRAARWRAFPAPAVLGEMQSLGVTHVIVHTQDLSRDQVAAAAAVDALQLEREGAGIRMYRLRR